MNRCRIILILLAATLVVMPTRAGIFFNKKKPANPDQRVPELLIALKTETNERKRAAAAEELRHYDPIKYSAIVPALADAATTDPKPGVRIDALESLAKLRPISQQAGMTLEQVLARDSNWRVRLQARSALWQYHLAGYRAATPPTITAPVQTGEPPMAPQDGGVLSEPPLATTTKKVEPEIIVSPEPLKPIPPGSPARRMPAGPPQPPVIPTEPPQLVTPPTDGPELNVPQ